MTAIAATWPSLPAIGNLEAYISAVNRMPMLTQEEETQYARDLKDKGDQASAAKLVMSHLRMVVSIARQYLASGVPQGDLIQEGNVGLMKAVARFETSQGVRLYTYALHWVRAEIHEFIIRNYRMVRLSTTKAQRKLFFRLRTLKAKLQQADGCEQGFASMTESQVAQVAKTLNVDPKDVREMEIRLAGEDLSLDPLGRDDEDGGFGPVHYLADNSDEPTQVLLGRRSEALISTHVPNALQKLDARTRRIIEARWLEVDDDGRGGKTLHDLAAEFGVSAERIRQIEVSGLKKLRTSLACHT